MVELNASWIDYFFFSFKLLAYLNLMKLLKTNQSDSLGHLVEIPWLASIEILKNQPDSLGHLVEMLWFASIAL